MEERNGESSSHGSGSGKDREKAKEKETLWSSILASTGKNRGGERERRTAKRVIVMGPHHSGRSTLIASLGRRGQLSSSSSGSDSAQSRTSTTSSKGKAVEVALDEDPNPPDLGISFEYIDLRANNEQSEEDTPSHLSIYSVPSAPSSSSSSSSSFSSPSASLLPLALTADSLLDTIVVITIDWEKPWLFLRQLQHQLEELRQCIEGIERHRGKEWIVQEGREQLENYFRNYVEPTITRDANGKTVVITHPGNASSSLAASTTQQDRPPLPVGTLDINLGVGIVVVCTKSDNIQQLERSAQLSEEQIDYIQQALRTVCLQYGASLHFTSHTSPPTFARLRSYLLHRLYTSSTTTSSSLLATSISPSASTTITDLPATTTTTAPTSNRSHPFPFRANAIERDSLLIPTGWDTWGKIRVLREGYDASRVAKGWRRDCGLDDGGGAEAGGASAVEEYEGLIRDVEEESQTDMSKPTNKLDVQYEQDFFKAHYDILSREASKSSTANSGTQANGAPRPSLQNRGLSSVNTGSGGRYAGSTGVVGPMSSGGLSLPSVEKALERESGNVMQDGGVSSGSTNTARSAGMNRRESTRQGPPAPGPISPSLVSPGQSSTSPTLPGSATQPQNEVLANFFQSLLNARTDRGGGAGSPVSGAKSPVVPTGSGEIRRSDSRSGTRE